MRILLVLICVFSSLYTFGQNKFIELEKKKYEALIKKDYVALDKIFADDLEYYHSNGKIDSKQSYINGLKNGERIFVNVIIDTIFVRKYKRTAILNGDVFFFRTHADGIIIKQKVRFTSVYIKNKRNWQMASWHSTDITNKK